MATGKKRGAPAPRPRSGFATEEMRHTERLTLRLRPDVRERLDTIASDWRVTRAEAVTRLIARERPIQNATRTSGEPTEGT